MDDIMMYHIRVCFDYLNHLSSHGVDGKDKIL